MTVVNAVEVATTSSKPNNGKTLINIVLDETGSMNSCWDATIASFNDYIGSQKTVGGDCSVSLSTFSTQRGFTANVRAMSLNMGAAMQKARDTGEDVRPVFENVNLQEVGPLSRESYKPNGGTNLYDAIGLTIERVSRQLEGQDTVPNVLVVIITDGEENASREYNLDAVKKLIQAKEQEGWTFVYLGANQDAWKVGASFGLAKGQTMSYSTDHMDSTMATLSAATATYRSTRSALAGSNASLEAVERNFFDNK